MLLLGAVVMTMLAIQRQKVVVEIGTGTWCQYCPGAALGADDLMTNNQPVGVIENHNGDTFANTYSNTRNTYYNITGFPTAFFDGGNSYVGGNHTTSMYSNYLPRVTSRYAVPSHFTLNAAGSANGDVYTLVVNANKVETDTNTGIKLHACITQSNIQFSWQGQTHLEFVNRVMMPSASGTDLDFSTNPNQTVTLTFTRDPSWPVADLELVIFLQNNSTKEILQGERYALTEIGGANPVSVSELSFPNTYLTGTNTMPFTINNYWNSTLTGNVTCSNPAFSLNPAAGDYSLNPYGSQTYNVTFSPTVVGAQTGTITVTTSNADYPVEVITISGTGFFDSAPTATNVNITGIPVITTQLTGSYHFDDAEMDTEGNTIKQWYRIQGTNNTPIDGATGLTYRITQNDLDYAIGFQVTPVDQWGMVGTAVMSTPTAVIGALPAPQNLTCQVQNSSNVFLDWDPPQFFNLRDFVAYKVYRDDLNVQTITNLSLTSWTDINLSIGDYEYWVIAVYNNPLLMSESSNHVIAHVGTANEDNTAPVTDMMVYPNPCNNTGQVILTAKANMPVSAFVYNIKGQHVKTLAGTTDAGGFVSLPLSSGTSLTSGIYFVKTNTGSNTLTRKFIITQ